MSKTVLDASALLALLSGEQGSEQVQTAIEDGAAFSTVNLSEVVAKLAERGLPATIIHAMIDPLKLDVVVFEHTLAYQAGLLRPATRQTGLSFGDRACLALAQQLALPALTADHSWTELQVGVTVQMVR